MNKNNATPKAVTLLLRPLVRLLIRSGIGFATFAEWTKQVYVRIAEEEFPTETGKQSVSRIATLTGMHRKEVARIRKLLAENPDPVCEAPASNRAQRVTNAWMQDALYVSDTGKPLTIPVKSEHPPSFHHLVKQASGDIYPKSILDELILSDIVGFRDKLHIYMKKPGYVPMHNHDEQMHIFGQSGHDFLATLEHNLNPETTRPFLQVSVSYKHLSSEVIRQFQQISRDDGMTLLMKLNTWLAERAEEPPVGDAPHNLRKAGFGIYYFEEQSNNACKDD